MGAIPKGVDLPRSLGRDPSRSQSQGTTEPGRTGKDSYQGAFVRFRKAEFLSLYEILSSFKPGRGGGVGVNCVLSSMEDTLPLPMDRRWGQGPAVTPGRGRAGAPRTEAAWPWPRGEAEGSHTGVGCLEMSSFWGDQGKPLIPRAREEK